MLIHYNFLQTDKPSPIGRIRDSTLLFFFIYLLNSLIFTVSLSFLFSSATSPYHNTLSVIIIPDLLVIFKDFSK